MKILHLLEFVKRVVIVRETTSLSEALEATIRQSICRGLVYGESCHTGGDRWCRTM